MLKAINLPRLLDVEDAATLWTLDPKLYQHQRMACKIFCSHDMTNLCNNDIMVEKAGYTMYHVSFEIHDLAQHQRFWVDPSLHKNSYAKIEGH